MIRRICLYGGPGSGKSTLAALIFSKMKQDGKSVEHCHEYVKRWVYNKRNVKKHDQIYLFAKQQQLEYSCLDNGVNLVITDSPCFLSYVYATISDEKIAEAIGTLCENYDNDFKPLNIFINRGDKEYKTEGRYQNLDQAKEIDSLVKNKLSEFYGDFIEVNYSNIDLIYNKINEELEIKNK